MLGLSLHYCAITHAQDSSISNKQTETDNEAKLVSRRDLFSGDDSSSPDAEATTVSNEHNDHSTKKAKKSHNKKHHFSRTLKTAFGK